MNVKIRQNYIIFTNKTIGNRADDEHEIVFLLLVYIMFVIKETFLVDFISTNLDFKAK